MESSLFGVFLAHGSRNAPKNPQAIMGKAISLIFLSLPKKGPVRFHCPRKLFFVEKNVVMTAMSDKHLSTEIVRMMLKFFRERTQKQEAVRSDQAVQPLRITRSLRFFQMMEDPPVQNGVKGLFPERKAEQVSLNKKNIFRHRYLCRPERFPYVIHSDDRTTSQMQAQKVATFATADFKDPGAGIQVAHTESCPDNQRDTRPRPTDPVGAISVQKECFLCHIEVFFACLAHPSPSMRIGGKMMDQSCKEAFPDPE